MKWPFPDYGSILGQWVKTRFQDTVRRNAGGIFMSYFAAEHWQYIWRLWPYFLQWCGNRSFWWCSRLHVPTVLTPWWYLCRLSAERRTLCGGMRGGMWGKWWRAENSESQLAITSGRVGCLDLYGYTISYWTQYAMMWYCTKCTQHDLLICILFPLRFLCYYDV